MRQRLVLTVSSLALAGAVLAGCGSDAKKATIPKADFITRADKLCKKASDDTDALGAPKTGASDKEFEAFVDKAVAVEVKSFDAVGDLPDPDQDAAKARAIFADARSGFEKLGKLSAQQFKDLQSGKGTNPLEAVSKRAKAYGFKDCGS